MTQEKTVINELTVGYKKKEFSYNSTKVIGSEQAKELADNLLPADRDLREYFYVIFFSTANRIVGYQEVCKGGMNGSVVDVKMILSTALLSAATAVILVHNHPSGSLQPSPADKKLTEKLSKAAWYMDIRVLDHIILNGENSEEYYSFADQGLMNVESKI